MFTSNGTMFSDGNRNTATPSMDINSTGSSRRTTSCSSTSSADIHNFSSSLDMLCANWPLLDTFHTADEDDSHWNLSLHSPPNTEFVLTPTSAELLRFFESRFGSAPLPGSSPPGASLTPPTTPAQSELRQHDCMWSGRCTTHPEKGCHGNRQQVAQRTAANAANAASASSSSGNEPLLGVQMTDVLQRPPATASIVIPQRRATAAAPQAHTLAGAAPQSQLSHSATNIPAGRSLLIKSRINQAQPSTGTAGSKFGKSIVASAASPIAVKPAAMLMKLPTVSTNDFLREREFLTHRPDTPLSLDDVMQQQPTQQPTSAIQNTDTTQLGSNRMPLTCSAAAAAAEEQQSSTEIINFLKEQLEDPSTGSSSLLRTRFPLVYDDASKPDSLGDLLKDIKSLSDFEDLDGMDDSDEPLSEPLAPPMFAVKKEEIATDEEDEEDDDEDDDDEDDEMFTEFDDDLLAHTLRNAAASGNISEAQAQFAVLDRNTMHMLTPAQQQMLNAQLSPVSSANCSSAASPAYEFTQSPLSQHSDHSYTRCQSRRVSEVSSGLRRTHSIIEQQQLPTIKLEPVQPQQPQNSAAGADMMVNMLMGVQTPSDSEEEIDVVSVGDKSLPTNPATAKNNAALQSIVRKIATTKAQHQQQRAVIGQQQQQLPSIGNGIKTMLPRRRLPNEQLQQPLLQHQPLQQQPRPVIVGKFALVPSSRSHNAASIATFAASNPALVSSQVARKRIPAPGNLTAVSSAVPATKRPRIVPSPANVAMASNSNAATVTQIGNTTLINSSSAAVPKSATSSPVKQQRRAMPVNGIASAAGGITSEIDLETDTIEKRNLHNNMERQRRIGLKNLFDELKDQLPSLKEKERAPKVTILREAALLCSQLHADDQERIRLKRMQEQLYHRVSVLRTQLAAQRSNGGAPTAILAANGTMMMSH